VNSARGENVVGDEGKSSLRRGGVTLGGILKGEMGGTDYG